MMLKNKITQSHFHSPNTSTGDGQSTIEYMLLLTAVVAVVLIGFRTLLPEAQNASALFFNRASSGIVGAPNPCGDGICNSVRGVEDENKCCADCGKCRSVNEDGGWDGTYF